MAAGLHVIHVLCLLHNQTQMKKKRIIGDCFRRYVKIETRRLVLQQFEEDPPIHELLLFIRVLKKKSNGLEIQLVSMSTPNVLIGTHNMY